MHGTGNASDSEYTANKSMVMRTAGTAKEIV